MIPKYWRVIAFVNGGILLILTSLCFPNATAHAEECTNQDFSKLFFEEYYPNNSSWVIGGSKKIIRWTTSVSVIAGDTVSRAMTPNETIWLREAIQSWDEATTSISFEESTDGSGELMIGWVPREKIPKLVREGTESFWYAWWSGSGTRYQATISFVDGPAFLKNKDGFIHAARHELGNILGLGDIRPSNKFNSVMEDPWQPPYGMVRLDDFDYALIRQLYGESTCPGTWKSQTTTTTTSTTTTTTSTTTPTTTTTTSTTTPTQLVFRKIICIKGKLIKQVSGVRPKCPAGYKKK